MRGYKLIFFQSERDRQWRWRIISSNGRSVAVSGEGYKRYATCRRVVIRLLTRAHTVEAIKQ